MNDGKDWIMIEEYKTLRDECVKIFEQRSIPLVYMSAMVVTLITAGVQFKEDFIFSLILTSIFPVAVHWIGKRYAIARISYYIKTYIEPNLSELNWENWIWHQRGDKLDDFEAWIVSSGVIYFYVFIGLAGAGYYTLVNLTIISLFLLIYNIILAVVLLVLTWVSSGTKLVWRNHGISEKIKTS